MANGSRLSIAITPNGGQSGPSPAPHDCLNRNLAFSRKRVRRVKRRRTLSCLDRGVGWGVGRDTTKSTIGDTVAVRYCPLVLGLTANLDGASFAQTGEERHCATAGARLITGTQRPRGGVVTQRSANPISSSIKSTSILKKSQNSPLVRSIGYTPIQNERRPNGARLPNSFAPLWRRAGRRLPTHECPEILIGCCEGPSPQDLNGAPRDRQQSAPRAPPHAPQQNVHSFPDCLSQPLEQRTLTPLI
jgi:hypothetical protein